jgi:hypothetical protein
VVSGQTAAAAASPALVSALLDGSASGEAVSGAAGVL